MTDYCAEKAFIFRVTHLDCVPWILDHGLQSSTSPQQDPNYINIGHTSLIEKRSRKAVPVGPGGMLGDYVPFYFTPYSIMMFNLHTGHRGITRRENDELVIFVSSLHRIRELGLPFVFTNQHAYVADAEFFTDLAQLSVVDWPLLRSRDFKTDDADPGKQARYQAEALIHRQVPLTALRGLACHRDSVRQHLESLVAARGLTLKVNAVPRWYFQ
jgi:hypothetical protein